jgi:predicted PolB exonuclease-like 3'-5' exonuclease
MAQDTVLTFDIETVADSRAATDGVFPKPIFHQIVAISLLTAKLIETTEGSAYKPTTLHSAHTGSVSEEHLVKGFFRHIEQDRPRLVSFNGRGFDLPVLKYRALRYGISAPWLANGQSRWENYGQRYSVDWHVDLMDALGDFGASKFSSLDEVCTLVGAPGKDGVDGSQIVDLVGRGQFDDVRNYCETDVLNTYLIFLRYALFRGEISIGGYDLSITNLKAFLIAQQSNRPYFGKFFSACADKCWQQR